MKPLIPIALFFLNVSILNAQHDVSKYQIIADSLRSENNLRSGIVNLEKAKEEYVQNKNLNGFVEVNEKLSKWKRKTYSIDTLISFAESTVATHPITPFDNLNMAQAYFDLGYLFVEKQKFGRSRKMYTQAVKTWKRVLGSEHYIVALTLFRLGGVNKILSDYQQALVYQKEALNISLSLKRRDSRLIGLIYNSIGNTYASIGKHHKALEYYEQALRVELKGIKGESIYEAYYYNNMGVAYQELALYEMSEEMYLQTLKIYSIYSGPNSSDVALIHNNLGILFTQMSEFNRALDHLEKSISIYTKVHGKEHRSIAPPLTTLGLTYFRLGKLDTALSYYNKALKIRNSIYGQNHAETGRLLNFIGDVYYEKGQYRRAYETYQNGQLANQNHLLVDSMNVGNDLDFEFGNQLYLIESLSGQSRSLLEMSISDDSNDLLSLSLNVSFMADSLIHSFRGDRTNRQDKLAMGRLLGTVYETAIRSSMLLYSKSQEEIFKEYAFAFSEKSRAMILREGLNNLEASRIGLIPDAIKLRERKLRVGIAHCITRINELRSRDQDSIELQKEQERLFTLNRSSDSLMNYLEREHPAYYNTKRKNNIVTMAQIKDYLDPEEMLISYLIGQDQTYIFSVTNDKFDVAQIPNDSSSQSSIMDLRKRLEESVSNLSEQNQDLEKQLYRTYVKYLNPTMSHRNKKINKLILIPDGQLSFVPFEILMTEDPESLSGNVSMPYLVRKYSLQYGYSATLLFNTPKALNRVKKKRFVGFAPSYDNFKEDSDSQIGLGKFRDELTELSFNQPEIQKVNEYMNGETLTGSNASEIAFKQLAKGYQILHLAMHAYVDHEDPMNSKLVFTQNNDSIEDNFLHAYELYNMEIKADMVVLSACETGFGKLAQGEGVMSLARAFTYAGCPSVVMSHWPVNDATTSRLMGLFYKYLSDGLPKDQALRQAKLEFLETADPAQANPYFWGSFVVMGDASPIKLRPKINWWFYGSIGLGLILVIAIFSFKYHKRWQSV